ncbi:hypothetical protein K491DRAFT_666730 [Lophiostoma macrostomum CBS 122681]|uniref:BTB domain-containing protein n=1 Tax=Lophiostoma macrostomum CBS 122681 TaxID=1314788 RepID=A0A6A6SSK9_9PLEO|nr:hypothetical protein K491DRAFT_666730 [Lophiostoma macrostomum CBS 122681]
MVSFNPIHSTRSQSASAISFEIDQMFGVEVGPLDDRKGYVVYAGILSRRSEYFARAMKGPWKELEDQLITLHDFEPRIFEIYLNHVYTDRLPTMTDDDSEWEDLALTYVLCEWLQDCKAKDAIILAMLSKAQKSCSLRGDDPEIPGATAVQTIYLGTPDGSPARRLLTDIWTCSAHDCINEYYDVLPKDFLRDLTIYFLRESEGHGGCLIEESDGGEYLEIKEKKVDPSPNKKRKSPLNERVIKKPSSLRERARKSSKSPESVQDKSQDAAAP